MNFESRLEKSFYLLCNSFEICLCIWGMEFADEISAQYLQNYATYAKKHSPIGVILLQFVCFTHKCDAILSNVLI